MSKFGLLILSIVLGFIPGGLLFGWIVYTFATFGEEIFKTTLLWITAVLAGLVGFVVALTPIGIGLFSPKYDPGAGRAAPPAGPEDEEFPADETDSGLEMDDDEAFDDDETMSADDAFDDDDFGGDDDFDDGDFDDDFGDDDDFDDFDDDDDFE